MKNVMKVSLVALSVALSSTVYAEKLVFGTIPDAGTGDLDSKFSELFKHIKKETGYDIEIVPIQSYAALVLAMKTKQVDFAYMGAKLYVDAVARANAKAIVVELNEQKQPGYRSILVTSGKTPSHYKHVTDFKGKKFAFVDLNSTSGGLIPSIYFAENNIVPKKFFSRVLFTGSHEAAMMSVRNNKVDLAVTNDLDMMELIRNGRLKEDDFRILWKSDLIPGSLYAVSGHTGDAVAKNIQKSLVSFDNRAVFKKLGIGGFAVTNDAAYDSVRKIIEEKRKKESN